MEKRTEREWLELACEIAGVQCVHISKETGEMVFLKDGKDVKGVSLNESDVFCGIDLAATSSPRSTP